MATPISNALDDEPVWQAYSRLALLTTRLFFGLPEYFVMKALLAAPRQRSIPDSPLPVDLTWQLDDTIAERLKLDTKYVRRLLASLKPHGLVVSHTVTKVAAGEERLSAANRSAPTDELVSAYWGLEFEHLADSVKYKLHKMEQQLGDSSSSGPQSYVCPVCQYRVTTLDVEFPELLTVEGIMCPKGREQPRCFGVELKEEDNSVKVAHVEKNKRALRVHVASLYRALEACDSKPRRRQAASRDRRGRSGRPGSSLHGRNGGAHGRGGGGGGGGSSERRGGGRGVAIATNAEGRDGC